MCRKNNYTKLAKDFSKIAENYCNKVQLLDYINLSTENFTIKYKHISGKTLGIYTEQYEKKLIRTNMIEELEGLEYERGNKAWNTFNVIPFMEDVMNVFTIPFLYDSTFNEAKKAISARYNVPVSRLKTQLALFIRNYENGKDKFGIGNYFTDYDLFFWKYGNDYAKLQDALENNKLTKADFKLMHELFELDK